MVNHAPCSSDSLSLTCCLYVFVCVSFKLYTDVYVAYVAKVRWCQIVHLQGALQREFVIVPGSFYEVGKVFLIWPKTWYAGACGYNLAFELSLALRIVVCAILMTGPSKKTPWFQQVPCQGRRVFRSKEASIALPSTVHDNITIHFQKLICKWNQKKSGWIDDHDLRFQGCMEWRCRWCVGKTKRNWAWNICVIEKTTRLVGL